MRFMKIKEESVQELTLIVWSSEADRRSEPSGENCTQGTQLRCPLHSAIFLLVSKFHSYKPNTHTHDYKTGLLKSYFIHKI